MAKVCKYCKSSYRDGYVGNRCPRTECTTAELIEIDDFMVPLIMTLWEKGYDTKACCSGHITNTSEILKDGDDVYIAFDVKSMAEPFTVIDRFVSATEHAKDNGIKPCILAWTGEWMGLAFYLRWNTFEEQLLALKYMSDFVNSLPSAITKSPFYYGGKDGYWALKVKEATSLDLLTLLDKVEFIWEGKFNDFDTEEDECRKVVFSYRNVDGFREIILTVIENYGDYDESCWIRSSYNTRCLGFEDKLVKVFKMMDTEDYLMTDLYLHVAEWELMEED